MIDAAIDNYIHDAAARGAVVAVALSSGKDSTAAEFTANAILDAAGHPRSRRIACTPTTARPNGGTRLQRSRRSRRLSASRCPSFGNAPRSRWPQARPI